MPNWCKNDLLITCDEHPDALKQLTEFTTRLEASHGVYDEGYRAGQEYYLLLDTFVPMPEKYRGTVSGSPSVHKAADDGLTWYEWAIANWGTKWSDADTTIEDSYRFPGDDGTEFVSELRLRFDTPWCPPEQALLSISAQFPLLTFFDDWDEESPSKGYLTIRAGEVIETKSC
jgi:hypothetical protein